MPESTVQVTEGAGKKLHTFNRTIGTNSVEDEIVVQGEPYLASYICNFSAGGAAISLATANSHVMQIMAGATLKVRIRRIEIWQHVMATTAVMAAFAIVRLSTAGTGGTVQTVASMDAADPAPGATCMSLPTVKGTETQFAVFGTGPLEQTIGTGINQPQPLAVWDFDRLRSKSLIIAAGTANGIAVKNLAAYAAATVWVNVWLDEANF